MNLNELLALASSHDQPLITSEHHKHNDFYGHAYTLKKFLNFPENISLNVVVEHGPNLTDYIWDLDLNSKMVGFICASKYYANYVWKKKSNKPSLAIGPFIHYAEKDDNLINSIRKNSKKILLAFPNHSTHYIIDVDKSNILLNKLLEFKKDFDKIIICMYWKDILLNKHLPYLESGYECVTAGHMYNFEFLKRLKSIILSSDAIITDNLGTHIGYSIYLNKPIIYLDRRIERIFTQNVETAMKDFTFMGDSIELVKKKFSSEYNQIISVEQTEFVNKYWGLESIKSKDEIIEFLVNLGFVETKLAPKYQDNNQLLNDINANEYLNKSYQNIQQKEYHAAMNILNYLKSKKAYHKNIDFYRSLCFYFMNNDDAAVQAVLEELRYFPNNSEAKNLFNQLENKVKTTSSILQNDEEFANIYRILKNYTMLGIERLYSLYTLAKKVCQENLQGDFVECGVAAGGSSALLAYVIKKYSKIPRKLYSCDSFEGMPAPTSHDYHNGIFAEETGWGSGTCSAPEESLLEISRKLNVTDVIEIKKGYFNKTLQELKNQIEAIAFLHMDGDWYESTKDILENLYDKVTANGFIQIDDYGFWEGCRKAVDEFSVNKNHRFELNKIDSTGVWFTKKYDSVNTGNYKLVNLGCGNRFHKDWINIDFKSNSPLVKEYNLKNGIPLESNSCDVVYHSHVLEHFTKPDAAKFINECYRVLKKDGIIRVVVPDLERIAREYINNLSRARLGDAEAAKRYDWIMLEMYDQTVRNYSGGEMLEYWRQPNMPAEKYVIERMGSEVKQVINSIKTSPVTKLVDESKLSNEEIGRFRRRGEIHQWMYDNYSLSLLLSNNRFENIKVCSANQSEIPKFNFYYLDVEPDGSVRKPDSLFMEARKV